MTAADDPVLDAMTAAPRHHDLLMENDQVRVLDTRLASGETLWNRARSRPIRSRTSASLNCASSPSS